VTETGIPRYIAVVHLPLKFELRLSEVRSMLKSWIEAAGRNNRTLLHLDRVSFRKGHITLRLYLLLHRFGVHRNGRLFKKA
jgi:hypothetical protein